MSLFRKSDIFTLKDSTVSPSTNLGSFTGGTVTSAIFLWFLLFLPTGTGCSFCNLTSGLRSKAKRSGRAALLAAQAAERHRCGIFAATRIDAIIGHCPDGNVHRELGELVCVGRTLA